LPFITDGTCPFRRRDPVNRGLEMESEVADGRNSVILRQVTNGLAVRMAVLFLVNQAAAEASA